MRARFLRFAILVLLALPAVAAEPALRAKAKAKAEEILHRIAAVESSCWAKYWSITPAFAFSDPVDAPGARGTFDVSDRGRYRMSFAGGLPKAIENREVWNVSFSTLKPTRPTPSWSNAKAARIAASYAIAAFGRVPTGLGTPFSQYHAGSRSGSLWIEGNWRVHWPRVSPDGYPFEGTSEGLTVRIVEGAGLATMEMKRQVKWTPISYTPISRTMGLDVALVEAKSRDNLRSFTVSRSITYKLGAANLQIVVPNAMGAILPSSVHSDGVEGRLAWVVDVQWVESHRPGAPHEQGCHIVWIDAETQRSLGGDFGMTTIR